ncbi:PilZ domain-containing protein [Bradyrhizobium sp. HKCCYLS1011]|uniref:PilZ domain-containing protein n=1 Tax=Bradyrhizobium sp. HKCCYLS1011 TaxID=3420733 RepID=UPI003EB7CDF7
MPAPKKREARKSMKQPAWVTLDGGFAVRHCLVQNISSAGAKITLDDAVALPATIRLAFARDARTGRLCQVVWRRGTSAGVKFIG